MKQDPPPVHIEGLAPDGQPHPSLEHPSPTTKTRLTAHFNSLSFRDERRTEFQWMLAGLDATWQPPRTERHVRYTHLPWGTYEFLVRARNGRTAWSEPHAWPLSFIRRSGGPGGSCALSVASVAGACSCRSIRRRVRSLEKETLAEQTVLAPGSWNCRKTSANASPASFTTVSCRTSCRQEQIVAGNEERR